MPVGVPPSVAAFLAGKRLVVAGVSRNAKSPANAIYRRLLDSGHEVIPVNPNAAEIEGRICYPDVRAVPGSIDGVMVVTHPAVAADVVRGAIAKGAGQVWFHRSFGAGSVSAEAVETCRANGIEPIVGGCPLMYCQPVDPGHRFFRWWLHLRHRVPG